MMVFEKGSSSFPISQVDGREDVGHWLQTIGASKNDAELVFFPVLHLSRLSFLLKIVLAALEKLIGGRWV
jgi:hypothetical protein